MHSTAAPREHGRCWQTPARRRHTLRAAAGPEGLEAAEPVAEDAHAEGSEDGRQGMTEEEIDQKLRDQGFTEEEIATMFQYQGQLFSEMAEEGGPDQLEEGGVRGPGCTPWQFVDISEETVQHEITVHVEAPLEFCYSVWADRLNYTEWFDLIAEMALPEDGEKDDMQGAIACFWCLYRWGMLPMLELYFVMERTEMGLDPEKGGLIVEESIEGLPVVAAALFRDGGPERGGTLVTLKLAYNLPENLREFVGKVGVWGDMNDILIENMDTYKGFVEGADPEALAEARAEDRETMREGARTFWEQYRKDAAAVREMAEAQGAGIEPPLSEAQVIARERAEQVRQEQEVAAEIAAELAVEAADAEEKRSRGGGTGTRGRGRGRGRPPVKKDE